MRLKLLITFSLFNILNGQENKNLNYKEDQIYFALNPNNNEIKPFQK